MEFRTSEADMSEGEMLSAAKKRTQRAVVIAALLIPCVLTDKDARRLLAKYALSM